MTKTRSQSKKEREQRELSSEVPSEDESHVALAISKKKSKSPPLKQKRDQLQELQQAVDSGVLKEELDSVIRVTNDEQKQEEKKREMSVSNKIHIGTALLQDALTQMISDSVSRAVDPRPRKKRKLDQQTLSESFPEIPFQPTPLPAFLNRKVTIKDPSQLANPGTEEDLETEDVDGEASESSEVVLADTENRDKMSLAIDQLYDAEEEDDEELIIEAVTEEDSKELSETALNILSHRKNTTPNIINILKSNMSIEDKSKALDYFFIYKTTETFSEERVGFRNLIKDFVSTNALNSEEDLEKIESEEVLYRKIIKDKRSLRQRIHSLETTMENKSMIYEIFSELQNIPRSHEDYEERRHRLEMLLDFPFGVIKPLPVEVGKNTEEEIYDFLVKTRKKLDENVLYLDHIKDHIIAYLAGYILNPTQVPNPIALEGEPGTGKTTLVMKGIAEALDLPFFHYNAGGTNDISELRGSDRVYRNSGPGYLFQCALKAKCLNFVFYVDEGDKTSDGKNEVMNFLIHLFDTTMSSSLQDGYFKGISFDFSRCMKIVSYNSSEKLGNIFGDRIQKFVIPKYSQEQRKSILKTIILPRAVQQANVKGITFTEAAIDRILSKQTVVEKGLRQTTRNVEHIIKQLGVLYLTGGRVKSLLNTLNLTQQGEGILETIKFPLEVTGDIIDLLWYEPSTDDQRHLATMYL